MLQKLLIKNVALIDAAEIYFSQGLNVLSGETGAGKSVILESINFVLGAKADKSLIRHGEDSCFVQIEFDVSDNKTIKGIFADFDFDEDDLLIISRKFNIDGKNVVKINGNSTTVGMLKRFTQALVDVHGQSEHFALLKNSNQLELIDRFAGDEVEKIKEDIKKEYSLYKQIVQELEELGGDDSQRLIRIDILSYQINEIKQADIKENEETELEELKKRLINQEKIGTALSIVKEGVFSDRGANDVLSEAKRSMSAISSLSEEYSLLYERLEQSIVEIRDIAETASTYLEDVFDESISIDYVENRLETIRNLKRKYGDSIEGIMKYLQDSEQEKQKLENFNEIASSLLIDKEKKEKLLYKLYNDLSEQRKKASVIFAENVKKELIELNMPSANFVVDFKDFPTLENCNFNLNGIDLIEFLFSANKGEPVKPLSLIISGGEMSRFMIGVKAQTSEFNEISTFIFDEIDSGMSGNTAKVVAQKFARISKNTQIIAISHLPQISAMADNNLLIVKTECNEKTSTNVLKLLGDDKKREIARLMGGLGDNQTAIKLSEELINDCDAYKKIL